MVAVGLECQTQAIQDSLRVGSSRLAGGGIHRSTHAQADPPGPGMTESVDAHPNGYSLAYSAPMNGYPSFVGGTKFSLMVLGLVQRTRLKMLPALSLVPDARLPPNGCWPTTAPVGLSLM